MGRPASARPTSTYGSASIARPGSSAGRPGRRRNPETAGPDSNCQAAVATRASSGYCQSTSAASIVARTTAGSAAARTHHGSMSGSIQAASGTRRARVRRAP